MNNEIRMSFRQNNSDFSYEDTVMTNPSHLQDCHRKTEDNQQVSNVRCKKFSFLWSVNNFKQFMDRQYEFTSPLFYEQLSSSISKWRMILHPENIYPEGVHVALRLLILSEVDESYSVMNEISILDKNGKQHKLKTREKVFRRSLDFDDCPIISNFCIKDKDLLADESLVIKCEFDLLECVNLDDETCKSARNLDNSSNRSCEIPGTPNYKNKNTNVPFTTENINDLSYAEPCKKSSDNEKELNTLIEKDSLLETSRESEISNFKTKDGLEILSNELKHLYYNTSKHDVVIFTDDGKRTAHEIILTSRSKYFKNALLLQKDKEIHVANINSEILDAVLYYLYTGKLKQMTEDSAMYLIKASKLLELPCLENMTTETFLKSRIKANNVTNVFLLAKNLKIESLKNNALKFMAENRDEVMKTEQWNDLMRNDPHSAGEVLFTISYYRNK